MSYRGAIEGFTPEVWIAPYGHDVYGDGTKEYPFATITKAVTVGVLVGCVSGYYYNQNHPDSGIVYLLSEGTSYFVRTSAGVPDYLIRRPRCYNCVVLGYSKISTDVNSSGASNTFAKLSGEYALNTTNGGSFIDNTIVSYVNGGDYNLKCPHSKSTIVTSGTITIYLSHSSHSLILVASEFIHTPTHSLSHSLLVSSLYTVNGNTIDLTAVDDEDDRIQNIRNLLVAEYGGTAIDYLEGCRHFRSIDDVKFNDPNTDDYTLKIDSPAANMSDLNSYVGARDVALRFWADVDGSDAGSLPTASFYGDYDGANAVNMSFNQASADISTHYFSPTDTELEATISSKFKETLGRTRELLRFFRYGTEAPRNGSLVSPNPLVEVTPVLNGGSGLYEVTTIAEHEIYRVTGGTFVYNGNNVSGGEFIIGVAGQTTATTSDVNARLWKAVNETDTSPHRKAIEWRVSNGSGLYSNGAALQSGYWYVVEKGAAVYKGKTYNIGESFLTDATTSWTGINTDLRELVEDATEPWLSYEEAYELFLDNDGDSTADDDYDHANSNSQFKHYVQHRIKITPNGMQVAN